MGRGRRKKVVKPAPHVEGATVIVDNEGASVSSLEPGCVVVSLRRFPAVLKERIGILQARRKVAGMRNETLEMLHAYIAELGVIQLEREVDVFEGEQRAASVGGVDERESNP